ncbi:MAG: gas vesicle protein [Stigonema ocellatum SAG 48.90 = DSM 106950]|nr:gas vesicle protein [Stigonema ocellatum SAG 48.90 = DSM 106950]
MKSFHNRNIIRPKVTTMPRNRTEASTQLELYKMITEKQKIYREMNCIKERMSILQKSLDVLNHQIADTEKTINQLRHNESMFAQTVVPRNIPIESNNYETFEMEY